MVRIRRQPGPPVSTSRHHPHKAPLSERLRRDLLEAHANDLGGADALSGSQAALCRRAATLEVELERMEGRMSLGQAVDLDTFARAAGHLRRILEALGIRQVKAAPRALSLSERAAARQANEWARP